MLWLVSQETVKVRGYHCSYLKIIQKFLFYSDSFNSVQVTKRSLRSTSADFKSQMYALNPPLNSSTNNNFGAAVSYGTVCLCRHTDTVEVFYDNKNTYILIDLIPISSTCDDWLLITLFDFVSRSLLLALYLLLFPGCITMSVIYYFILFKFCNFF